MDGYIVHGLIDLARGSWVLIEHGRGMGIELWDGSLWITQDADTRDYMVKPDSRFRLDREGLVIAYALRASRITLTAPVPAYYARRIVLANPAGNPGMLYQRAREPGGWLGGLGHRLARRWTRWFAPDSVPATAGL
jgi:hypothetical protein